MFDNDLEMACFLQDLYVELNERHELHDAIFNLDSILRAIDEFDINVLNGIFIINAVLFIKGAHTVFKDRSLCVVEIYCILTIF